MLQYLMETLAFQLIFLAVFDLFLKKETFFQLNRAYLLIAFILSLVLPLIKIEALKTVLSQEAIFYPDFLWEINGSPMMKSKTTESSFWELLDIHEWVFLFGAATLTIYFGAKLYRIQSMRNKGTVRYYSNFTKVVVKQSKTAFSFFKLVFLGDGIAKEKEPQILAHELVHVKQWHSLDLLFFELMRIPFWFNPLVYFYQYRIAELHEYIADAQVTKSNKKAHYELLLSEVFQTQNLSFVNQFFKTSLTKKRIVMLNKQKSKIIFRTKYALLLPLVFGILLYTSCEIQNKSEGELITSQVKTPSRIPFGTFDNVPVFPGCENSSDRKTCFLEMINEHIRKNFNYPKEAQEQGIEGRVAVIFTIDTNGNINDIEQRGPSPILEAEVKRIIQRLPKMKPGTLNGEAVNVAFSTPVVFKLNG
ncbi:M56 family metallopeptidase [Flavobacteriaceae bacterium GF1]